MKYKNNLTEFIQEYYSIKEKEIIFSIGFGRTVWLLLNRWPYIQDVDVPKGLRLFDAP